MANRNTFLRIANAVLVTALMFLPMGMAAQASAAIARDALIRTTGYLYDRVGNRSQKIETTAGGTTITNYAYDANDRLMQESRMVGGGSPVITAYTWDDNGNLRKFILHRTSSIAGTELQESSSPMERKWLSVLYFQNSETALKLLPRTRDGGNDGAPFKPLAYALRFSRRFSQTSKSSRKV